MDQIRFLSPHSHIPFKIGIRDLPSAALLKWHMIGEVLIPGDIEKTDGCKQAAELAEQI